MRKDYILEDYMKKRFAQVGRKNAFKADSVDEYQNWKTSTRAKLKELIGYDTMLKTKPNPRKIDCEDLGTYTREHVEIQTEPGVWMPFYILKPKTHGRLQPVIAAHGHSSGGKLSVAGVKINNFIRQAIKDYNYDYGHKLAQQGFMVFCPDARGFGQRKDPMTDDAFLASSCRVINNMAIPLGQTITGMWTWDLHRLIDYISSRDDCDIERLCCLGLSGGGLQTLWATALDDRIKAAVVSGYFYGYEQSLLVLRGNCSCNYVPHLWEHVDMGDIAALIAPRKLMIETGNADPLNGDPGLDNVKSQLEITSAAYELLAKTENLKHSIQPGEHKWYGVGVVDWLKG